MQQEVLSKKEMYSTIRFIALEYGMKNGPYSKMYLYVDPNKYPLIISVDKKTYFTSQIKAAYMPVKHIILFCLYNEYKLDNHLGILVRISRLLDNMSDLEYAKILGVDVSTYRMLENQTFENKGLIHRTKSSREYQFTPKVILEKLNIPADELVINLEDYYE